MGTMQKRRFPVGDREMDGIEIEFEPVKEPWSEYQLQDGGRFKMRLTVQRVFQLLDDEGKHARTPTGERFLVVESQNQLVVQE